MAGQSLPGQIICRVGRDLARGDEKSENIFLAAAQDIIEAKDYKTAIDLLEECLRMNPSSFPALNNLVVIYRRVGQEAKSDSLISEFIYNNRENRSLMKSVEELIQKLKYLPPDTGDTK